MAFNHNNALKILTFLLDNKEKEFSIREISKQTRIDYKSIYLIIFDLEKRRNIIIKKAGNIQLCKINLTQFDDLVYSAENFRKGLILKNKNIYVSYNRIKEYKNPYFSLLIFGSYASKTQKSTSDIDLLLITNNTSTQKDIQKIITSIPLNIHLNIFTSEEFISMIKSPTFNVGKEAFKNNIILSGIENYYGLIQ